MMISYQLHVLGGDDGKLKMALTFVSHVVSGGTGWDLGSAFSWSVQCRCFWLVWRMWQLADSVLCLGGPHRAEGKPLGQGLPLLVMPSFWLELGHGDWLPFLPLWGGGGSQATSDKWTAAVTPGAVLLFLDGKWWGLLHQNCFETFLGQGRAFQVALCSNLKHKERCEEEGEKQWCLPSAQPTATAACLSNSPWMVWITSFPSVFQLASAFLFLFDIFTYFAFWQQILNDCGLLLGWTTNLFVSIRI